MKTKFLKLMVLPMLAFFLASAAAVSTDKSEISKTGGSAIMAYIHNPASNSCKEVTVNCAPGGGDACLSGTWTAYLFDSPVSCNAPLHRVP